MKVGISVLPALAAIFIGGFARCNGQQQPDQLLQTDEQQLGGPDEDGGVGERNVTDKGSLEPQLTRIRCQEPADCQTIEEAYCDIDLKICVCKPDYPITDRKHCYKESKYGEFCRLDLQCQHSDKNSRCNLHLNVCQCQNQFKPQSYSKRKQYWCVERHSNTSFAPGSYYDPALFGIMGGLILMFIVLCVVLQLFAKAQFSENRTIFNTPNPRLMNVSLMKNNRKTSNCPEEQAASNAARESRRKAVLATTTEEIDECKNSGETQNLTQQTKPSDGENQNCYVEIEDTPT